MYTIQLEWTDFKTDIIAKGFPINFQRISPKGYNIFAIDRTILWMTYITDDSYILDFETNYQNLCNKYMIPLSSDGKEIIRSESRPLGYTTVFTCQADSNNNIGDGKLLAWDFSNQEDEIEMPTGSNIRKKRIEFKFLDNIHIKEGAVYFFNTKKGTYGDVYIVCPEGQYYLDNDKQPHLATEDTIVEHYMIHQFIQGDCPMGDEFNTEACSEQVPLNYKFYIEITSPISDNESNGYIVLELYRIRTVIL